MPRFLQKRAICSRSISIGNSVTPIRKYSVKSEQDKRYPVRRVTRQHQTWDDQGGTSRSSARRVWTSERTCNAKPRCDQIGTEYSFCQTSSATRPVGRVICNRSAPAGFASAHGIRLIELKSIQWNWWNIWHSYVGCAICLALAFDILLKMANLRVRQ